MSAWSVERPRTWSPGSTAASTKNHWKAYEPAGSEVGLLVLKTGCGERQSVWGSISPFAAPAGDEEYQIISDVPFSSALGNHPLDDTRRGRHKKGSCSISVSHRYRAIYVVDEDTNVWYWIGSHEDYNVFTGRK